MIESLDLLKQLMEYMEQHPEEERMVMESFQTFVSKIVTRKPTNLSDKKNENQVSRNQSNFRLEKEAQAITPENQTYYKPMEHATYVYGGNGDGANSLLTTSNFRLERSIEHLSKE